MSENCPQTANPHIGFQSPVCKLESLTVTIQTCVLAAFESSGVELQRAEKGGEDIWEDNQRFGRGREEVKGKF